MNNDFDKRLDLHESEWSKADKKEPFFGPGAYWFFNVTLPTLAFVVVASIGAKFIYRAALGY